MKVDVITNGRKAFLIYQPGSPKRCGGIGDVLSGLTGLYAFWARNHLKEEENDLLYGCILAAIITRKASELAF